MWPDELIGIDFSGDARQWRRTSNRSNVWIATGRASGSELYVTGLCTVQELPGSLIAGLAGANAQRLRRVVGAEADSDI
jgi:hypothetical protein